MMGLLSDNVCTKNIEALRGHNKRVALGAT